jgi:lipoprotein NlpI
MCGKYALRWIGSLLVTLCFLGIASASPVDDIKAGADANARGAYDEAIRLETDALESGVLSAVGQVFAFYNRGNAWQAKGNIDRAIADYTEAIRLNPRLREAFNNRGNAWKAKGDLDRAIADYTEAIRLNPQSKEAFNDRGSAWQSKGDLDRAVADYSEAIRLDSQYALALKNRGRAQYYQGKFSSAVSDLTQSQQLQPNTYTALWLYLARTRGGGEAKVELSSNTRGLDEKKWPAALVGLYLGKATPATVTSQAGDSNGKTREEQLCEAHFYLGAWSLLRGEKQQARTLFTQAQNDCPKNFAEYTSAMAELERLK